MFFYTYIKAFLKGPAGLIYVLIIPNFLYVSTLDKYRNKLNNSKLTQRRIKNNEFNTRRF